MCVLVYSTGIEWNELICGYANIVRAHTHTHTHTRACTFSYHLRTVDQQVNRAKSGHCLYIGISRYQFIPYYGSVYTQAHMHRHPHTIRGQRTDGDKSGYCPSFPSAIAICKCKWNAIPSTVSLPRRLQMLCCGLGEAPSPPTPPHSHIPPTPAPSLLPLL